MLLKPTPWDGKPITGPCWVSGMSLEDYHRADICAGPSVSSTSLKTVVNKGAKHFWRYSSMNPDHLTKEPTKAMEFGSAFHAAVLEAKDFRKKYVVHPETYPDSKTGNPKPWTGQAKFCQQWVAEKEALGLVVLTPDDVYKIRGMAKELSEHPLVRDAKILNGWVETSLFYIDKETGLFVKVRPDIMPSSDLQIADVKSTGDISDDGISKAVGDLYMHQQGALIGEACKEVLDEEMASFSLVFSHTEEPFEARVHTAMEADLQQGFELNTVAMRTIARCLDRGVWPGLGGEQRDAQYVSIQPWRAKQLDRRLQIMKAELG